MSDGNPFEDRARAAKAARIVRVLRRVLYEDASITVADLERADDAFRQRVGELAKVKNPPSERTWMTACGILREQMQRAS